MIESIKIQNFTAFKNIGLKCSKGINVFIGANSTGKSHLLKLMYAVCSANKPVESRHGLDLARNILDKLNGVFKPEEKVGRLCRNHSEKVSIRVDLIPKCFIAFGFSNDLDEIIISENQEYEKYRWIPTFIPPKEMLSNFPGFTSLYLHRELTIDETYFDLCQALEMPGLKGEQGSHIKDVLKSIQSACDGEFLFVKQQRFYFKPAKGNMIEAELSAEGFRKLGILQRLLQNGRIQSGVSGPLFWDEPEANLNPALIKTVVAVLLELARNGQQIFLATHNYVLLKWLDLMTESKDDILFHALSHNDEGEIELNRVDDYLKICPNAIDDAYAALVDTEIAHSMGDLGK